MTSDYTTAADAEMIMPTNQPTTISVVNVVSNVAINKFVPITQFLAWLESPKRKGKRENEITCSEYKEMLAAKRAKKKEEDEQKNRKLKRKPPKSHQKPSFHLSTKWCAIFV